MSQAQMLQRMRASQIPPHAYTTTLRMQKQEVFAAILMKREYNHGPAGNISYLVQMGAKPRPTSPNVARVCAIAAKELVNFGEMVYYSTVPEMMIGSRMYEKGIDSVFWYADRLGNGYIVIGDIGEGLEHRNHSEWQDLQALLLSHLARGGGLILGKTSDDLHLTEDFLNALSVFTTINVE